MSLDDPLSSSDTNTAYHEGYSARYLETDGQFRDMSRDDQGQFSEQVGLSDVLNVFDLVDGPVVTSGDVASATGCSQDTARRKLDTLSEQGRLGRRKTSGRVIYWRLDTVEPAPVDPDDPIFTNRPSFASGTADLSDRVDELLYEDS